MNLMDWFCGEGGAGRGYELAGWSPLGVDNVDFRKRYPPPFLCADILKLDPRWIATFDGVHASPPCQFVSEVTPDKSKHVNLIPPTRALLIAADEIKQATTGRRLLWTIENVRAARPHLINPVSLFGTMFDMHVVDSQGRRFELSRERLFETNWPLVPPWLPPQSEHPIANVFGGHFRVRSKAFRTGNGTGRTVDLPGEDRKALARKLMEMPWATMAGMSEAVPPPYTEFIGVQMMRAVHNSRRRAA